MDQLDFEAIEVHLRSAVLQIAARALEQRLNADTSDNSGPEEPCTCGQTARLVDRRDKSFTSVLGDLTLKRAYYHRATRPGRRLSLSRRVTNARQRRGRGQL